MTSVDRAKKAVYVSNGFWENILVTYDYLILATGVTHSYFGPDEFATFASGLKGLADAVAIRNKILRAFEQAEAEAEGDPSKYRDLLTFVLVGGGPTGWKWPRQLRCSCGAPGTFAEELSQSATKRLEHLRREVRLE